MSKCTYLWTFNFKCKIDAHVVEWWCNIWELVDNKKNWLRRPSLEAKLDEICSILIVKWSTRFCITRNCENLNNSFCCSIDSRYVYLTRWIISSCVSREEIPIVNSHGENVDMRFWRKSSNSLKKIHKNVTLEVEKDHRKIDWKFLLRKSYVTWMYNCPSFVPTRNMKAKSFFFELPHVCLSCLQQFIQKDEY